MRVTETGSFDNIERFLKNASNNKSKLHAEEFAKMIIDKLKKETKVKSGKTANSWTYKISQTSNGWYIDILNTNINNGVSIAKILHYGHGTGTGGWVEGTHYITKVVNSVYKDNMSKIIKLSLGVK